MRQCHYKNGMNGIEGCIIMQMIKQLQIGIGVNSRGLSLRFMTTVHHNNSCFVSRVSAQQLVGSYWTG